MEERTKPTIEELEKMLASDQPLDIEILPNGEVRAVEPGTAKKHKVKIITAKYAQAEYY